MSTATKPYGHQYDYLTKINNNKCKGYWVVEDSHKFTSRVASVENTANKADLVLYYIHGMNTKWISWLSD
jgi:hypothetical protein